MKTIGVYHDKDLDGLMCAAIMKRAIPDIELIGWDYSYDHNELLEILDKEQSCFRLIMADLSLPNKDMQWLAHKFDFTWIDHHVTAINSVNPINITTCLDSAFAACELCWMYFFPNEPMPSIVETIGKYDTWRKDRDWGSKTLPVQMYYRLPDNFKFEKLLNDIDDDRVGIFANAIYQGKILVEFENGILQSAWDTGQESFIEATLNKRIQKVPSGVERIPAYIINTTVNPSRMLDVCGNKESDILCTYYKSGNAWKYSLRSLRADVGQIAKQYGGGGHKHAAGFQLDYLLF